jgi:hypothetical protein
MFEGCFLLSIWDPYTHDNINELEMVQRRAARYVQNNYHNTSSVTSMIDTLGWPTLVKESIDGLEIIVCGKMFHCTIVCGKKMTICMYLFVLLYA